jgi:hypothetical protein
MKTMMLLVGVLLMLGTGAMICQVCYELKHPCLETEPVIEMMWYTDGDGNMAAAPIMVQQCVLRSE